jgi:hypothetical protein
MYTIPQRTLGNQVVVKVGGFEWGVKEKGP